MMPFSVLRTWLGGIFSWLILGAAIFALWEWADGVDPPAAVRRFDDKPLDDEPLDDEPGSAESELARAADRLPDDTRGEEDPDRLGGWPWLAAGLGLLALSFGGWLPVLLLLGQPGAAAPTRPTGETKIVERPDGSRLHVEILGATERPTLLFTHGWSLESAVWTDVITRLTDQFRIVIWDLPGLGKSRGPTSGDYRLEKMADDLAAVLAVVGSGPVVLVGHSIGGMISQTFCRLHREQLGKRVVGIVLLHTTYINPLNTALGSGFWKAIEKPILVPLNYLTIWLAPLAWLSNWQSFLNGNMHLITRLASFSGKQSWGQLNYAAWLAAVAWPGVISRGNLAMLEFDEQKTLASVEVPVLVVAGRHDRMTSPEASERLAQLLPNSIESSIDTGHLGFWERPAEVAQLLAEFAERCVNVDQAVGKNAEMGLRVITPTAQPNP